MDNLESSILKIYMENIKRIGGRGPKNAYVKIIEGQVGIYFIMDKSPFEQFIFKELVDGPTILEDLYLKIEARVRDEFISRIELELGIKFDFDVFEFDSELKNFKLLFKRM